jgi:hypothetical protein
MKRLVLFLCICAALAVPAIALARPFPPDSHFQGRVDGDPNTYFGFGTTDSKKHKKVRHVAVALPTNCFNGDQGIVEMRLHQSFDVHTLRGIVAIVSSSGSGSAKLQKARAKVDTGKAHRSHLVRIGTIKLFFGEVDIKTPQGKGEAYVYGEIGRHGRTRGYIQMKTHSNRTGKCYSGGLEWRAHRGAHVDYPPPTG